MSGKIVSVEHNRAHERRAVAQRRAWAAHQTGSSGPASPVRKINPATGLPVEVFDLFAVDLITAPPTLGEPEMRWFEADAIDPLPAPIARQRAAYRQRRADDVRRCRQRQAKHQAAYTANADGRVLNRLIRRGYLGEGEADDPVQIEAAISQLLADWADED